MISCIITRRLLINNNQFDYLLPVVKNKEDKLEGLIKKILNFLINLKT